MVSTGILKLDKRVDAPYIYKNGNLNINAKNENFAFAA